MLDEFYKKTWEPFESSFPEGWVEQYISIFSIIKFKGAIPKARSFPELQGSWVKKKPAVIVKELEVYSDIYSSLVRFEPISGFHRDVNEKIQRLSLMPKTTVTWPYVLQLLQHFRLGKVGKKQVTDCLSIVESFLVRRAIVGLEPTGLHAVFKSLWNKAGADSAKLKEKIVTTTIRCPGDLVVTEALKTENMYSRQITKYLLIQREVQFNKKNGYDNALDDFSAEHILPRNRAGNWATLFSKAEHAMLVHTIGNLVPLTKGQNSRIKDSNWAVKKTSFKGSNWKTAQKLSLKKKWDKGQIERRTREFTQWAVEEWRDLN